MRCLDGAYSGNAGPLPVPRPMARSGGGFAQLRWRAARLGLAVAVLPAVAAALLRSSWAVAFLLCRAADEPLLPWLHSLAAAIPAELLVGAFAGS